MASAAEDAKATVAVPNEIFQANGKTDLLLIARILNQVGFLGDCIIVVELTRDEYQLLESKETPTTLLWQDQLELFQSVWISQGGRRNVSIIFLPTFDDLMKIPEIGDLLFIADKEGIRIRNPYASEPISVNIVNRSDDIVTNISKNVLEQLLKIHMQASRSQSTSSI